MSGAEPGAEIVPAAVITPAAAEPGLSDEARAAVSAGMPENTRRAYEQAWREFTQWCGASGRAALPTSTDTLTEYINWLCYSRPRRDRRGRVIPGTAGLTPSSVRMARWAIIKAHELAEVPAPHEKRSLLVIKGYEAALAAAHDQRARPRKATAMTPDVLREFTTTGLDGAQDLIAARDRAMFCLGYSAALRVSEIVALDITDVRETELGLLVTVYRSKRRLHKDAAIPAADAPETVRAVKAWIAALRQHSREDGPLFPRISKSGVIGAPVHNGRPDSAGGAADGRMTAQAAGLRLKLAQETAGVEGYYTPHSGRRGFATQARFAGHDRVAIGRHGGAWADGSTALDGYMEDADQWRHNPLRGAGI